MEQFILSEGALNDNELLIADNGKVFKGGYVAIIKEWVYLNSWSNRLVVKKFKSLETLNKYISKNYPQFNL